MIKKFLFEGKIPLFKELKLVLFLLSFTALLVFLIPKEFKTFGEIGWGLLIFIVYIRPLSDVFPKIGLLKTLTMLRKEAGILCGSFILAHSVGFFLRKGLPFFSSLINPKFWDFTGLFGWGMVGFIATFLVILTSNNYAIKKLKKYWKPIQRLTYLIFLVSAIHIGFASDHWVKMGLILGGFIVLWILAYRKVMIWK